MWWLVTIAGVAVALLLLAMEGWFYAQNLIRTAARESLPQIDGTLAVPGLAAPVTVERDTQGVPHIHAATLDDLEFAQGFVTAQDRLFQMDLLRRHAAGTLAEVLGESMLNHDRMQRTLQVRAAADRALAQLPAEQTHMLERYAAGVNASIAVQGAHLPVEFRILRYDPAPWTPRDSLLVTLAMFEDLTNAYSTKLARESLVASLPATLTAEERAQIEQDLYPVGSWRDQPPGRPIPDLTIQGPAIEDVPLDESQSRLELPPENLQLTTDNCLSCTPGSNDWVVSGAHTASGKPLLSNDMHLSHTLPGIWYEADLKAADFHAAGVSLPGVPLIVVGHNEHIAWGFTNLGADVQDVYVESTRGTGAAEEFKASDGTWQPVVRLAEPIKIKGGKTEAFEVLATRHGDTLTPILNPVLGAATAATRTLALRWTIYDPGAVNIPTLAVDRAHDWASFLDAFREWGGPAQNVVYADDQGHIGYHAMGKIPLRGPAQKAASTLVAADEAAPSSQVSPPLKANPDPLDHTGVEAPPPAPAPLLSGPLSAVPVEATAANEWSGYIPFDALPQVFDPPGGVLATANARTTPDDYPYPVALNWAAPYRNQRIWHLLAHSKGLTPADMLAIQTDITSDFDRMLAERLTYALDHSTKAQSPADAKTLRQAADLLRTFKGRMATDSAAASIVSAVHAELWPMLLEPKLHRPAADIAWLYAWGEKDYALEEILTHTPPRWLPAAYADWNEFLAAAVVRALKQEKAPADLEDWRYGAHHTVDIEHPVFGQSALLRRLIGVPTGTGSQPQSGDGTTIKQVGHSFGPSERFTADLADLDRSTLNVVEGESGNPMSQWFLDQFPAWLRGTTFVLPFSDAAVKAAAKHTLVLTPK
jgi:penicillin amidase